MDQLHPVILIFAINLKSYKINHFEMITTKPHILSQENVVGDRCDRCEANTFFLSAGYELGCVQCFCMGVSAQCQSTSWNRAQVTVNIGSHV